MRWQLYFSLRQHNTHGDFALAAPRSAYKLGWLHTRTPCALQSTSLPAAAMHNGAKRKEPFRTPRVMQRFSPNAIALVKEKHMSRKTCVL